MLLYIVFFYQHLNKNIAKVFFRLVFTIDQSKVGENGGNTHFTEWIAYLHNYNIYPDQLLDFLLIKLDL